MSVDNTDGAVLVSREDIEAEAAMHEIPAHSPNAATSTRALHGKFRRQPRPGHYPANFSSFRMVNAGSLSVTALSKRDAKSDIRSVHEEYRNMFKSSYFDEVELPLLAEINSNVDASDSILTTSDLTSDLSAIIEALMELGNDQEHPGPCSFLTQTQVSASSKYGADMKPGDASTSCAMDLAPQSNEQATGAQAQLNENLRFYTSGISFSTGSAASVKPSSLPLPQRAKTFGNGTSMCKYYNEDGRQDDDYTVAGGRVKRKAAQLARDVQYARVLASQINRRQHRAADESTLLCAVVAAQSSEQLNKTKNWVSASSTSTPGVSSGFPASAATAPSSPPLKRRIKALENSTTKYYNEDDSSYSSDQQLSAG